MTSVLVPLEAPLFDASLGLLGGESNEGAHGRLQTIPVVINANLDGFLNVLDVFGSVDQCLAAILKQFDHGGVLIGKIDSGDLHLIFFFIRMRNSRHKLPNVFLNLRF